MTAVATPGTAELAALVRGLVARHPEGGVSLWSALTDAGALSAALPVGAGGDGLGRRGHRAVLTELGRAVAVTPYRDAVAVAAQTLAEEGTPDQRRAWLGTRTATAWCEPEGSVTVAEPEGEGWRVTGAKSLVQEGMDAELFLVTAATDDGRVLLAVPPAAEGLRREPQRLTDAVIGAQAAWIELEAVQVGPHQVVGAPGDGTVDRMLARHTLAACAEQLGVLDGAVRLTATYAREREQFGKPLGAFQAVSQRLADAYIDVRAAELTLDRAIEAVDTPEAAAALGTAAYWAAEAGHRVAHTCVHIHGGTGLDLDHPAHRHFAAAKRIEFELGGATRQLLQLAGALRPARSS